MVGGAREAILAVDVRGQRYIADPQKRTTEGKTSTANKRSLKKNESDTIPRNTFFGTKTATPLCRFLTDLENVFKALSFLKFNKCVVP